MLIRMLTWPFKAPAIWLVGFWTLTGWALAALIDVFVTYQPDAVALAIGFTLPAWYLLLGSLSMHGQALLLHEARGLEDGKIEHVADLNPYTSGLAVRLMLPFLTVMAIEMNFIREDRLVAAGFAAFAYAAPWLTLCLEQSVREGLDPRNWLILLRGLHIFYIPISVLVFIPQLAIVHVLLYHHEWWAFTASGVAFIAIHALVGRSLFYAREGLDLYTERSPEQDAAAAAMAADQERADLWNDLHLLASSGKINAAYQKLDAWMDKRYIEQDPVVHERLKEMQDQRLMLTHAVHFLRRLLEADQTQKAWLLFKECLTYDDRFRPLTADAFLSLTRGATRADAVLVNDLLADFDMAYPDSPAAPQAAYRRARILRELLNEPELAREVLARLAHDHPDFVAQPKIKAYLRSLPA
jgi:hypothetical protein